MLRPGWSESLNALTESCLLSLSSPTGFSQRPNLAIEPPESHSPVCSPPGCETASWVLTAASPGSLTAFCRAARPSQALLCSEFSAGCASLQNQTPTHIWMARQALPSTSFSPVPSPLIPWLPVCFACALTMRGSPQRLAFPGFDVCTWCSLFLKCTSPTPSFCKTLMRPPS